jgi:threonine/homoserine/homoserine lactone efflux protein
MQQSMDEVRSASALRLGSISFVVAFSGAMMPGSLLAVVIEQTILGGFRAVIGLITGHALLELVLIILLTCGLRPILAAPRVRGIIGIVGGLALAWMGSDMLRHAFGLTLDLSKSGSHAYSWWQLIGAGVLVSLGNPYFLGWWATAGIGQIAQIATRDIRKYAAFFVGHEGADYAWYSIVGAIIVTGRRWFDDRAYQYLVFVCGGAIVFLGLWFLISGGKLLWKKV